MENYKYRIKYWTPHSGFSKVDLYNNSLMVAKTKMINCYYEEINVRIIALFSYDERKVFQMSDDKNYRISDSH